MSDNKIKQDLEARKGTVSAVSAYDSLRKSIDLLAVTSKTGVVVSALVSFVLYCQILRFSPLIVIILGLILFFSFLAWIMVSVIEQFVLAMIDGVDLQLLSNRRSELDRELS